MLCIATLSTPELFAAGESSLPELGLRPAVDLLFDFNVAGAGAGAIAGAEAAKILKG